MYVGGDYSDPDTYEALDDALGGAKRPAHYLAIPPAYFSAVLNGLTGVGLNHDARVIVEKPFGRDLATARELNEELRSAFPENAIFLIDHFLGKEEIMNLLASPARRGRGVAAVGVAGARVLDWCS